MYFANAMVFCLFDYWGLREIMDFGSKQTLICRVSIGFQEVEHSSPAVCSHVVIALITLHCKY